MKRKLLLILFIVTSIKNFSQQTLVVPEIWEMDGWFGDSWVNTSKVTYTFDDNCNPIIILAQFNNEGILENASLMTNTFNSSNQAIQGINQIWDSDTTTWINTQKFEHSYNGENLIQTTNYNWVVDAWVIDNRSVNTYDSSGFFLDSTNQNWDSSNSIWVNVSKNEVSYDSENRLEISTSFDWNVITMVWENDSMRTNFYINSTDLLFSKTADTWNINQWVKNYLETYTYDANNFLIESLRTEWDTPSMSYLNDNRIFYTNNGEGYPTTIISQTWFSFTSSWLNTSRDRRTYPDCLTLSVSDFENVDVKVFPNPTIEKVFITTTTKANYILSNINGQLIKKGTLIEGSNTVSLSNLSKGLYFINIKTDEGSVTKKMIKQ